MIVKRRVVADDEAIVDMCGDNALLGRIGRTDSDKDSRVCGVSKASAENGVGKVLVEQVVGLFETIDSSDDLNPCVCKGMGKKRSRNITI